MTLEEISVDDIVESKDGHVLLVTAIDTEELFPVRVIHLNRFRQGQPNGYTASFLNKLGTKQDNPELLI